MIKKILEIADYLRSIKKDAYADFLEQLASKLIVAKDMLK